MLAVLSFRVVDPDGGSGGRWHVPRLRASDPERSSVVTTFAGGVCAIRRSAYLEAGGQPDAFFFGHEETDMSWRLLDLGYRIEYDAAATVCHPAVHNARHETWYRLEARNRVWLARRNLPWPLAAVYLADWMALTVARERSKGALRAWFAGFAEGWKTDPGTAAADLATDRVADDQGWPSSDHLATRPARRSVHAGANSPRPTRRGRRALPASRGTRPRTTGRRPRAARCRRTVWA